MIDVTFRDLDEEQLAIVSSCYKMHSIIYEIEKLLRKRVKYADVSEELMEDRKEIV